MPGLIAIADFKGTSNLPYLAQRMANVICHRSWHEPQWWVNESQRIALGRVHTGIFNPESQPVFNRDRSFAILMEGEIFVEGSLRRELSETGCPSATGGEPEILLHLYEKWGDQFVHKIQGSFNVIIWDSRFKKLFIANDRMGFRPLYYATIGHRLLVCSEIKGIITDPEFRKMVDFQGVQEYFSFGHPLREHTFFEGIQSLPGASICSFTAQAGWVRSQYWRFDAEQYQEPSTAKEQDYLEELSTRFRTGIERQLTKGQPAAQSLTAGLDSRAARAAIEPTWPLVATFTHGVANSLDLVLARRVAEKAGSIPHHSYELGDEFLGRLYELARDVVYRSDGFGKLSHTAFTYTRPRVRNYAQVELSCGGADYSRGWGLNTPAIRSSRNIDALHQACCEKYINRYRDPNPFKHSTLRGVNEHAEQALEQSLTTPQQGTSLLMRANYFYVIDHIVKLLRVAWQLISSDLELRFLYWDYDYVDLLFHAPFSLTTDERAIPKYFINRYNPALAKIPFAINNLEASFSETVLGRWKRRVEDITESYARLYLASRFPKAMRWLTFSRLYMDMDNWLRADPLRTWVRGVLLDRKTLERGYYSAQGVSTLLNKHQSRQGNLSAQIGALVMFELWCRQFLD